MNSSPPQDANTGSTNPAVPGELGKPLVSAWNAANFVTITRLLLAVLLFVGIARDFDGLQLALLFAVATASDALDGWLARRFGLVTVLGRILDPFVDKLLVCGTFVMLLERSAQSGVTAWMTLIVVVRELTVTGLRGFLEERGADGSAAFSGKLKMALQCIALFVALWSLRPQFRTPHMEAVLFCMARDWLLWLATYATIASGLLYVIRVWRTSASAK